MTVAAIVQARMSSRRLPGKVLQTVLGKPMLDYILERLKHAKGLDAIVVATSDDKSDDAIRTFCRARADARVRVFGGSLEDVAARFADVLRELHCDCFVRVNGDSPLLDQTLVTEAVRIMRQGGWDVVTNVFPRTFPKGQSVEVVKTATFLKAQPSFSSADDKEHVTRHFYENPQAYKIHNMPAKGDHSKINLSVDTPQDMARFERICSRMKKNHWTYGWQKVLELEKEKS